MLHRPQRLHPVAARQPAAFMLVGVLTLLALTGPRQGAEPSRPPFADARGVVALRAGPLLTAYPWPDEPDPTARDPWGYPKRQCTSYVAWFLNSHGVPFAWRTRGAAGVGDFGDADGWGGAARTAGFVVSATPAVGAIAHWSDKESSPAGAPASSPASPASSASSAPTGIGPVFGAGCNGHVAVVYAVRPDGRVDVAEYNGHTRMFGTRTDRAPRYLYIGAPGPPVATGGTPSITPGRGSPSPVCIAGC